MTDVLLWPAAGWLWEKYGKDITDKAKIMLVLFS